MMRTSQQAGQQAVGSKEPNRTGSASEAGETVQIKKRKSKSSRLVHANSHAGTCADSSKQRASALAEDLEARIVPSERMKSTSNEEAVMGKIRVTGSKPKAKYCQRHEKTWISRISFVELAPAAIGRGGNRSGI